MGQKTAEARALSARERARAKAAEYRERERRLESLAVDYFVSVDAIEKVHAARDREVAAAHAKAERAAADAVTAADSIIRQMLETGVLRNEVIDRLGCSAADVRRAAATSDHPADDLDAVPVDGLAVEPTSPEVDAAEFVPVD